MKIPLECIFEFYFLFMYRKPGWLWTDFHYIHKYLHNDEFHSMFHMGISYNVVPCKSIVYYIHSTLADVIFWNILSWTLSKVTTVFGVTLDTPTYIWFSKVILLQGFKIILSVTYYGHDINVWPKQPHLLSNLLMGDLIVLSPPILESLTSSKLTDFSVF